MKMTIINMDWTDTGAIVKYESTLLLDIRCPRCNVKCASGIEHRCGDREQQPEIISLGSRKARRRA